MDYLTPLYTQLSSSSAVAKDGGATSSSSTVQQHMILFSSIMFTLLVYVFESYLSHRQRSTYRRTQFPRELEECVSAIDAAAQDKQQQQQPSSPTTTRNSVAAAALATTTTKKDDNNNNNIDRTLPLLPQLQAKFTSAQSYGLDKVNFALLSSTYSTLEGILFVLLGFMPYMWDTSCYIAKTYLNTNTTTTTTDNNDVLMMTTNDEIIITLLFLLVTTIVGCVTSFPFEYYSNFHIEKQHGFNNSSLTLFITDKIKGLLLSIVLGGPFVSLLLYIIKYSSSNGSNGQEQFHVLHVWGFTFTFSLLIMTIYPILIMPAFNTYIPLSSGLLKDKIYKLANQLHFPLTKLFVMDGSKRSSHSNAFMFGFFKNKRIVLFDTLLTQVHDDEILAILGHELGHWKMGHTVTNFVISQLYTGAAFYTFSLCYNSTELYRAFGFNDDSRPVPTIIALLLFFGTVWEPIDKVISYAMTVHSRKCEFEADEFSSNLGMSRELQSGLCKIHLENLGAMCPDPWYSAYHYSHPPLVERLSAMMRYETTMKQKTKKTL